MEKQMAVPALLAWYAENARDLPWRRDVTPYRVWISEIMLQQTRVEAVKDYYWRFLAAVPDISTLAQLPEEQLFKLWEGLGYYSRARNLQRAARVCVSDYGGELPRDYGTLLRLPGIGPYTAGAIASIAFGIPVPAVDGNVLRVWSRFFADGADMTDAAEKRRVTAALGSCIPLQASGAFNQALMELGATVCLPNGEPKCDHCPISTQCKAHLSGSENLFPLRIDKKPRKIEERTVFLIESGSRFAIRKRPERGLLASLWELPGVEGTLTREEAIAAIRAFGAEPLRLLPLAPYKHVFTHIEWHVSGWRVRLSPEAENGSFVWADREELRDRYPMASAFRPYLALMEKPY